MAEISEEAPRVWEKRALKILIVTLVFPILLLVFHQVLLVPAVLISWVIVHFLGNPRFWATVISAVAMLPAGWGAVATCKLIWPKPPDPGTHN